MKDEKAVQSSNFRLPPASKLNLLWLPILEAGPELASLALFQSKLDRAQARMQDNLYHSAHWPEERLAKDYREPELVKDDVHIWRMPLHVARTVVEQLRELLSPDEITRANHFHFDIDRHRFIVARAHLRSILGHYLNVKPELLRFDYSRQGKPSLAKPSIAAGLNFNLSHSGGVALYGVTLGREIGVDVEQIRPEFAGEEIARRFFSPREVARLCLLPAEVRHEAFFNCWTRKEAFIKAKGIGLSLALDQFDVTLAPKEPAALLRTTWDQSEAARWTLKAIDVGPGYAAAVAVEGSIDRVVTGTFIKGGAARRGNLAPSSLGFRPPM